MIMNGNERCYSPFVLYSKKLVLRGRVIYFPYFVRLEERISVARSSYHAITLLDLWIRLPCGLPGKYLLSSTSSEIEIKQRVRSQLVPAGNDGSPNASSLIMLYNWKGNRFSWPGISPKLYDSTKQFRCYRSYISFEEIFIRNTAMIIHESIISNSQ